MSHRHDHQDDCQDHEQHGRPHGRPNTEFLDLELSKVMYAEAEGVTREAFRELLKEAAKRRLLERWGDRITELANLAVDELLDDAEANLEIEARIAARNHARQSVADRVEAILGRSSGADESGETTE